MTKNTYTNNENTMAAAEYSDFGFGKDFEKLFNDQELRDHFKNEEDLIKAILRYHIVECIQQKIDFREVYNVMMKTFPEFILNDTEFLLLFNCDESEMVSEDEGVKFFLNYYKKMFNSEFLWKRFNYKEFWTKLGLPFMCHKKQTQYNVIKWAKMAADRFEFTLGYIPENVKHKMKENVLDGEIIDRFELVKHKCKCPEVIDRFLALHFDESEIRDYFMKLIVSTIDRENLDREKLRYKLFGQKTHIWTLMPYTEEIYYSCIEEYEYMTGKEIPFRK